MPDTFFTIGQWKWTFQAFTLIATIMAAMVFECPLEKAQEREEGTETARKRRRARRRRERES